MPCKIEALISIHALREEGDLVVVDCIAVLNDFYPRPPRGGRHETYPEATISQLFLSTPSARRATFTGAHGYGKRSISIHALREEGDYVPEPFLTGCRISIHALREEGDADRMSVGAIFAISIHALREEGDSKNRDKISIFL